MDECQPLKGGRNIIADDDVYNLVVKPLPAGVSLVAGAHPRPLFSST